MDGEMVIIDNDGGTDDLMALMMALLHTTWTILAITCGFGNVSSDQACGNVLRLLCFLNRTEIPVYQGAHSSLLGTTHYASNYHGVDGMSGSSQDYPLPSNISIQKAHAAEILVTLADQYPGNVTLIALGPLTNVALALRLDPNLHTKFKQVYIMGGNIHGDGNIAIAAEFNFYSDPEAAFIVMNEIPSVKIIVPLETCDNYFVSWEFYDKWTQAKTLKSEFIRKIHQTTVPLLISEKRPGFISCDLQTMMAVLHPETVTSSDFKNAIVELQGTNTRGMLVVDQRLGPHDKPNAHFYTGINQTLMEEYWYQMII